MVTHELTSCALTVLQFKMCVNSKQLVMVHFKDYVYVIPCKQLAQVPYC